MKTKEKTVWIADGIWMNIRVNGNPCFDDKMCVRRNASDVAAHCWLRLLGFTCVLVRNSGAGHRLRSVPDIRNTNRRCRRRRRCAFPFRTSKAHSHQKQADTYTHKKTDPRDWARTTTHKKTVTKLDHEFSLLRRSDYCPTQYALSFLMYCS